MSDAPTCSRRAVLAGSLGLGVGALVTLTGCSGDELQDGGTERVPTADVPVGGGAIVGWYVVTQPEEGRFEAFHAACPHANVKVTGVTDEVLCDVHGARFTLDEGAVTEGPTRRNLTPAPFEVDGDAIVVSMP